MSRAHFLLYALFCHKVWNELSKKPHSAGQRAWGPDDFTEQSCQTYHGLQTFRLLIGREIDFFPLVALFLLLLLFVCSSSPEVKPV